MNLSKNMARVVLHYHNKIAQEAGTPKLAVPEFSRIDYWTKWADETLPKSRLYQSLSSDPRHGERHEDRHRQVLDSFAKLVKAESLDIFQG